MKTLQAWVSSMAGSVPDASTVVLGREDAVPRELLIRMYLADLLVPSPTNQQQTDDWTLIFCVGLTEDEDGKRRLVHRHIAHLVGDDEAHRYFSTYEDKDSVEWLEQFRNKIITGELL